MKEKSYYLKENMISGNKNITYGVKGEVVKVVSDFDNCFIVESEKGIKFGVNKNLLSTEKIEKDEPTKNNAGLGRRAR